MAWRVAFKDVTTPTNVRTMIAAITPGFAAGNTLPQVVPPYPEGSTDEDPHLVEKWVESCLQVAAACRDRGAFMVANLNALIFDYCARQKVQGQHLNWYIVEQVPVVPPARYAETRFGPRTAAEIVRTAVLELTYVAHDMAPFARDLGHVDATGAVLPPFPRDPARRLRLRAKLDAVFFPPLRRVRPRRPRPLPRRRG